MSDIDWKLFGEVAGVAGLGIGLVSTIFKSVVERTLRQLTEAHAFVVTVIIICGAWAVGIAGVISYTISNTPGTSGTNQTATVGGTNNVVDQSVKGNSTATRTQSADVKGDNNTLKQGATDNGANQTEPPAK